MWGTSVRQRDGVEVKNWTCGTREREMEASETGGREMEQGKQESMRENPTLKAISSPIN